MGILKKISKGLKRVAKGVRKVFKKVTKFVGRAMQSPWGKALLIAATIFTAGAAAGVWGGFGAGAAGSTAATQSGGFLSKFVGGAKSIFGVGQSAAPAAAGANQVASAAGALPKVLPVKAATSAASAAPGIMARAGQAAAGFLKSPGGALLAGNVLSGYAGGREQEAQMEEDERRSRYYDEAWRDPSQLTQLYDAASADLNTPMGFMNRARRVTQFLDERANRFPTVPTSPEQVAGYAVGA